VGAAQVKQADAASEGMDLHPRLKRGLHGQRDGNLALPAAFPAHEQAVTSSPCSSGSAVTDTNNPFRRPLSP